MRFLQNLLKSFRGWYNYSALFILTVVLAVFYLIQMTYLNSFIMMRYGKTREPDTELQNGQFSFFPNFTFEGEQLVHFDLKGAPPKISYLVDFIPFIKRLGASGILLEYEDMFPYSRGLEKIAATNAYSLSDIAKIIKAAENSNLTIIPLVPTFSHFEFVLKLQQFKHFREVEAHPHVLCPSKEKIYPILFKMIDQIMEAHPKARYLHIGSDEATDIGLCKECQLLMKKNKWRKDDIYFTHVKKMAKYIITTYPRVRPIIWGDKFSKQNEKTILSHNLSHFVDIMLWNYHSEKSTFPRREDMNSYAKLFKNIWIASAFKGATGSTQIITDPDYHFQNMKAWMYFVEEWKNRINFKGITLMGWQRYSHFSVLCELLPVGVPSLALCLHYLNKKKGFDQEAMKHALLCNDLVPVNLEEMRNRKLMSTLKCDYPGYRIYQIINSFYNQIKDLTAILKELDPGDMSFYSITNSISHPAHVHKLSLNKYRNTLKKLNQMEDDLRRALSEVYDRYTVEEWIATYVLPHRLRLEAAINIIVALRDRRVWPRRPLPNVAPRVRQFFNQTCGKTETLGCTLLSFK